MSGWKLPYCVGSTVWVGLLVLYWLFRLKGAWFLALAIPLQDGKDD